MFSQVCVKNSVHRGGCIPTCTGWGVCVSQHALGRRGVSQHALGRGVSHWAGVCGRHPLGQTPPGQPSPFGCHCSGRYASYWNAFLFIMGKKTELQNKLPIDSKIYNPVFWHRCVEVIGNEGCISLKG